MADGQLRIAADADVHEVLLSRLHVTSTGPRYSVSYNGEVIVSSSRDPERDACRALMARGITGQMRTRWQGSQHWAMAMDIEWGAARRTEENGGTGPRTAPWSPHPGIGAE